MTLSASKLDQWVDEPMPSLHQYNNASYVDVFCGSVWCNLCGTGEMPREQRVKHFHGARHARKYQLLNERRQEVFKERTATALMMAKIRTSKDFEPSIKRLYLQKWRMEIRGHFYSYIFEVENNGSKLNDICKLLRKYETYEICSLLELVLWKANLTRCGTFDSIQEVREYEVLDSKFDPDSFLQARRTTCGSVVVVPLVLEYLE